MNIILLSDYEGLGNTGDIVKVKSGFARNKLIPQGIALRASKRNLAIANEKKKFIQTRLNRESEGYKNLVKTLSKTEITIEAQVGDEEKMFGSITSLDIQKSLKEKGVEVDRNMILLDEPIRSLGIYHIKVRVAPNMDGDVKVYVIKS